MTPVSLRFTLYDRIAEEWFLSDYPPVARIFCQKKANHMYYIFVNMIASYASLSIPMEMQLGITHSTSPVTTIMKSLKGHDHKPRSYVAELLSVKDRRQYWAIFIAPLIVSVFI